MSKLENVFNQLMQEQEEFWKIPSHCFLDSISIHWMWYPRGWTEENIVKGFLGISFKKLIYINKYELTVTDTETGESKSGYWEDYILNKKT